jgi:hypothetical protein
MAITGGRQESSGGGFGRWGGCSQDRQTEENGLAFRGWREDMGMASLITAQIGPEQGGSVRASGVVREMG